MRTVRKRDLLVSERLADESCPSVVAVEPPRVRLARLCPAMACSRRRRSSWRKFNAWIESDRGSGPVRDSRHPHIHHSIPTPEPALLHKVKPFHLESTLQMDDGGS